MRKRDLKAILVAILHVADSAETDAANAAGGFATRAGWAELAQNADDIIQAVKRHERKKLFRLLGLKQ